jgi:fatty acid desaturase
MSDGSLSEREQRILEEIERNLVANDEAFVRRLRQTGPRRDAIRLMRLGIAAVILGFVGLVGFVWQTAIGIAGFVLMLAGVVAIALAVRALASGGRASGAFRDAWKRAEDRMRGKRGDA